MTEENRGQRAFEVADAGIEAAKRQLASNVDRTLYDGNGSPTTDNTCGNDDARWSALQCGTSIGINLNHLYGPTSPDSANVRIWYRSPTDDFRVISTGTYGNPPRLSMRRIEAIFKGVQAGAGSGESIGHPVYYTPSSIRIMANENDGVTLSQVSLFSRKDILVQSVTLTDRRTGQTNQSLTTSQQFADDVADRGQATSHAIKPVGGSRRAM